MKEFKINDYIALRLENEETNVYIDGIKVIQCKYLLLTKPEVIAGSEDKSFDNMDEITQNLDDSLELRDSEKLEAISITPETEFWAHCSNIQAWAENEYDTRMLHANLSFPLLKRLTKAGDPVAKNVFKKEIAKRFQAGNLNVMTFLVREGYLDYFDWDEHDALYKSLTYEQKKDLRESLKEAKEEVKEGFKFLDEEEDTKKS